MAQIYRNYASLFLMVFSFGLVAQPEELPISLQGEAGDQQIVQNRGNERHSALNRAIKQACLTGLGTGALFAGSCFMYNSLDAECSGDYSCVERSVLYQTVNLACSLTFCGFVYAVNAVSDLCHADNDYERTQDNR